MVDASSRPLKQLICLVHVHNKGKVKETDQN